MFQSGMSVGGWGSVADLAPQVVQLEWCDISEEGNWHRGAPWGWQSRVKMGSNEQAAFSERPMAVG